MSELKTLKDFEVDHICAFPELLKAEAGKWVKTFEAYSLDGFMYMAIFKKFFNLTDEDLKDEY